MALLRIPEPYREGLGKIIKLSETSVNEFILAIKEIQPTLQHKDFVASLASKIKSINPNDLDEIVRTLIAFCKVRETRDVPVPEFAEDIVQAVGQFKDGAFKFTNDEGLTFKKNLTKLLELEEGSLGIIAKAQQVLTDHEHTFLDARIITDVRSVFGKQLDRPAAAAIVHMLKIAYISGHEEKEFFVALDTGNIKKLRKLLDRADLKANGLKSAIKQAGLTCLDID